MMIYCPFCDAPQTSKSFGFESPIFKSRKVVDAGPRPMAKCSKCGALERERMLQWCMMQHLTHHKGKLLHFAPLKSINRWLTDYPQLEITNADLSPGHYKPVDKVVRADITELPFEENIYDYIVCSHVMEHVPDDQKGFSEVKRVLKPKGLAFFMVPLLVDGRGIIEDLSITDKKGRLAHFGQSDHVRIYDTDSFVDRGTAAGLSIDIFDPYAVDPIRAVAYGIGQGNCVLVAQA